jgi:hypothetical protein
MAVGTNWVKAAADLARAKLEPPKTQDHKSLWPRRERHWKMAGKAPAASRASYVVLKCQKISALLTLASRATSDIEVS